MRLKLIVLCSSIVIMLAFIASPYIARGTVTEVNFCRSKSERYIVETVCSGVLREGDIRNIYSETPVVASEVLVSVGDYVKKGQVLAVIDTKASKGASGSGGAAAGQAGADEIAAAMAQYGLTEQDLLPLLGAVPQSGISGNDSLIKADKVEIPAEITAPMSGVVTAMALKSGVAAGSGQPVASISGGGDWEVEALVNEHSIGNVSLGDEVVVTLPAEEDREFRGVVQSIAMGATRIKGISSEGAAVRVSVRLSEPDTAFKNDYSASVTILSGGEESIFTLPYEAIKQDSDNNEFVYIYQSGRAVKREITTGRELVSSVEVLGGVTPNDVIIFTESDLKNGDRISLKAG